MRELVQRLIAAGQWTEGDPDILVVADAGYDGPRLAWLLADLPVQVLARMRSDRALRRAAAARVAGTNGRPPRHGGEFIFGDPTSWGTPDVATTAQTRLYGQAVVRAWDRLHPRLTRRAAWADCPQLPIIAGTALGETSPAAAVVTSTGASGVSAPAREDPAHRPRHRNPPGLGRDAHPAAAMVTSAETGTKTSKAKRSTSPRRPRRTS